MVFLFCQFLLFVYFIYVDSLFHDSFMTFLMDILDVFIAHMGLPCNLANFDFILYGNCK